MLGLSLAARAAALALVATLCACSQLAPTATAPAVTTQLPRSVRPLHYDVAITPDVGALRFDGHVAIAIEVLEPTMRITLHAADLEISKVGLSGTIEDEAGFGAASTSIDAHNQTATFTFEKMIPPGRYLLVVEYTGRIYTQVYGLFAIDYDTPAGSRRALFTQLATADARRVVPSWDEPAYKATFTVEATIPDGLTAVSNMPVAGSEPLDGGRSRVRFAPTPQMSTYLLFFALGEFERPTARVAGTELGIVTRAGAGDQAAFVLQASRDILTEYNEYFGTAYPLPKLDNVAAPGNSQQFAAMENWGAILTFEHSILIDPSISTEADRQLAFEMAAHEISHQWFGNLVTMQWWDDLWLNEGFASWMETRTTARLRPEWRSELSSVRTRERAMERDALVSTHPVVQRIVTVEQATQAFDAITYSKGEAVVRMLEAYVGSEAWREGVRRYLGEHAYGTAVSDDLWHAIESAAGVAVGAIARDFTLQPGVPLVRVGQATCESGRTRLSLAQGEFSPDRPEKRPLEWRVPVIAAVPGNASARAVVRGARNSLTVDGCGPVVVNAGQSGYYRTLYAPPAFNALRESFATLPAIDQLGILSDSWALGLAGLQPVTDFLALASATPVGADPQVWTRIAAISATLDDYYRGEPARQSQFRRFASARLAPVLDAIGWSPRAGETGPVAILRNELIVTLGRLGNATVIGEARRRYAASANDPAAMPAALRKPILAVVARQADAATWEELRTLAAAEKTPLVKDELYWLLGSAEDPALARRALELALTPEPGATNSAAIVRSVGLLHPELAWDFAIAHLEAVMATVEVPARSRFLPAVARGSADPGMVAKIEAYAATLPPDARGDAQAAAAQVAWRARVRAERLPAIEWDPLESTCRHASLSIL